MRNQFLMSIGLYLALGCHVVLAQEWVPQKVVGMHYPHSPPTRGDKGPLHLNAESVKMVGFNP